MVRDFAVVVQLAAEVVLEDEQALADSAPNLLAIQ
jgi:hypothetical protein